MKIITRVLFVIMLLLIGKISLFSQNYQGVLSVNNIAWNFSWLDMPGVLSDTLFASPSSSGNAFDLFENGVPIAKLTESSDGSKLWIDDLFGNIYLVQDLNLNTGDTFSLLPNSLNGIVDSVYYEQGRKIIQFDVLNEQFNEAVKFIEGMGPNITVVYPLAGGIGLYMACKHHNEILVYQTQNPYFDGCLPLNTITPDLHPEKPEIWYSSESNTIIIKGNSHGSIVSGEFELYSINGQRLFYGSLVNGKANLPILKTGIYIFKYYGITQDHNVFHKFLIHKTN